tara:strand:- start:5522 stop:5737 length:216 start_codon:yes stop_codon:yes gene_type:complete
MAKKINPETISVVKALEARQNDIMKLFDAGKISGPEAANRIKKLIGYRETRKKNMGGAVMKNRGGTFKGTY